MNRLIPLKLSLLLLTSWIFTACDRQDQTSELNHSNKTHYDLADIAQVIFVENDGGKFGAKWDSFVQVSAVLARRDDQCTFVKPDINAPDTSSASPWGYVQVVWIHKDDGGTMDPIKDTFYPGYRYGAKDIKSKGGVGIRYLNGKERMMAKVVNPKLNNTREQLKLDFQIKGKDAIPLTITAVKSADKCVTETKGTYQQQHFDPLESVTIGVLPHSLFRGFIAASKAKNILVDVNRTE